LYVHQSTRHYHKITAKPSFAILIGYEIGYCADQLTRVDLLPKSYLSRQYISEGCNLHDEDILKDVDGLCLLLLQCLWF